MVKKNLPKLLEYIIDTFRLHLLKKLGNIYRTKLVQIVTSIVLSTFCRLLYHRICFQPWNLSYDSHQNSSNNINLSSSTFCRTRCREEVWGAKQEPGPDCCCDLCCCAAQFPCDFLRMDHQGTSVFVSVCQCVGEGVCDLKADCDELWLTDGNETSGKFPCSCYSKPNLSLTKTWQTNGVFHFLSMWSKEVLLLLKSVYPVLIFTVRSLYYKAKVCVAVELNHIIGAKWS